MTVNLLSPIQKAWLAGFIDGEGFIGITFQRKKENTQQSATPRYHPYLIITNKDKNSIYFIKNIVGEGRIYESKVNDSSPSPIYQYKLTKARELTNLLKEIKQYLIVKNQQCELLLEYLKLRKERKIITGRGSRGKTSFSIEEEEIYKKLLALNK